MNHGLDIIGDIGILNFHKKYFYLRKKFLAWKLLKQNKSLKVVLEKINFVSGELRLTKTRWLAGEKRRETVHKENGCDLFLNVDKTYFSPRLSNERKVVCENISRGLKNKGKVLVLFSGIGVFGVVLGRFLKLKKKKAKIICSELNGDACKFAEKNVFLNKLNEFLEICCGDSRNLKLKDKFDVILMPRPNLDETFLKTALKFSKKGTKIFYYGFGEEEKVLDEIKKEGGKKIGKIKIRKAGDIGPGKWRWLAEFNVK
jgi:tRNA (guanine37-N1)-methyltransferase